MLIVVVVVCFVLFCFYFDFITLFIIVTIEPALAFERSNEPRKRDGGNV